MFDTFRYVTVKFDETTKHYAYRCPFQVAIGDRVVVPTIHGLKPATVKGHDAHDHRGFPTAKLVSGFASNRKCKEPWPRNYLVRRLYDGCLLTHNQTRTLGDDVTDEIALSQDYNRGAGDYDRLVPVHPRCRSASTATVTLTRLDALSSDQFTQLSNALAEETVRRASEERRQAQAAELKALQAELDFRLKLEQMREGYRSLLESQEYDPLEIRDMVDRMAELHRELHGPKGPVTAVA